VAAPLTAAIRAHGLTRGHFERAIDARERDLAGAPPPTLAALEDYAEATSATLLHLALEVLGVREPAADAAARDIGIAYALAGLLRALPLHAHAGHSYIPQEIVAGCGLACDDHRALREAVRRIADAAAEHLAAARRRRAELPRAALPALLPAVVAERALARLRKADNDPFDPRLAAPGPLQAWRLLLASLSGRF
jgi:NADH dehydrogenase [ubiquinone] 1 alpha subcomplex assembly factor 6